MVYVDVVLSAEGRLDVANRLLGMDLVCGEEVDLLNLARGAGHDAGRQDSGQRVEERLDFAKPRSVPARLVGLTRHTITR